MTRAISFWMLLKGDSENYNSQRKILDQYRGLGV